MLQELVVQSEMLCAELYKADVEHLVDGTYVAVKDLMTTLYASYKRRARG